MVEWCDSQFLLKPWLAGMLLTPCHLSQPSFSAYETVVSELEARQIPLAGVVNNVCPLFDTYVV